MACAIERQEQENKTGLYFLQETSPRLSSNGHLSYWGGAGGSGSGRWEERVSERSMDQSNMLSCTAVS